MLQALLKLHVAVRQITYPGLTLCRYSLLHRKSSASTMWSFAYLPQQPWCGEDTKPTNYQKDLWYLLRYQSIQVSLTIWKTIAEPSRVLLLLWFCRHAGEQGLNGHETYGIFSGIVITCSHWIIMNHLANIISVNKTILSPLLLFLNLLPHHLWKVHNDDFFFFRSFPQPML